MVLKSDISGIRTSIGTKIMVDIKNNGYDADQFTMGPVDITKPNAEWSIPFVTVLSVTMAIFILLSIIGNLLVIIVIAKNRGMRTRTNMFLCNLAVVDFITGLLVMPVSLVTVIARKWVLGPILCQINGFMVAICIVTSIHTLMYIAFHKYLTITRPFSTVTKSRTMLNLMVVAAWIWGIVIGYLTLHGMNEVYYGENTSQCGPRYSETTLTFMYVCTFCLTCYVIPLVIMVYCYLRIFQEIRAASKRMIHHTNQELDVVIKQQKRIFLTLLSLLIVFCLCWTPFFAYTIVKAVTEDKSMIPSELNPVVYWFGYMNSSLNPIIYAWKSPAFRDGYREVICSQKKNADDIEIETPGVFYTFRSNLWTWMCQRLSATFPPLPQYTTEPVGENVVDLTDHLLHLQHGGSSSGSLPDDLGVSEEYSEMFCDILPDLRSELDMCRVSFDFYPLTAYYVKSPKHKRKKKYYVEGLYDDGSSTKLYLDPTHPYSKSNKMKYIDEDSSVSCYSDMSTDPSVHSIKSILKPSRDGYAQTSKTVESVEVHTPPQERHRVKTPPIPRIEISEFSDETGETSALNDKARNSLSRSEYSDSSINEPLTGVSYDKGRKRSSGALAKLFQRIRRSSKKLRPWKSQESVGSIEIQNLNKRERHSMDPTFRELSHVTFDISASPGPRSTSHNTLCPPERQYKRKDRSKYQKKRNLRASSLKFNIGRQKGHSLPNPPGRAFPFILQRSMSDRPGPRPRFMRLPSMEKLDRDGETNHKLGRRESRKKKAMMYLGRKRGSLPLKTIVDEIAVNAKLRRSHSDPAISIERLIDLYETRTCIKRNRNTFHVK